MGAEAGSIAMIKSIPKGKTKTRLPLFYPYSSSTLQICSFVFLS